jgi:hypothetical protein
MFLLAQLDVRQFDPGLMITLAAMGAGTLIAISAIIAGAWQKVHANRARYALTQQMVERGMTADEIALIVASHRKPRKKATTGATDLPCASEAVVESDGDWYPALVLQVAQGRYYIHYVGHDMDSNEWVSEDRIRFPTGSHVPGLMASLTPTTEGFNGAPSKPPVEAEL